MPASNFPEGFRSTRSIAESRCLPRNSPRDFLWLRAVTRHPVNCALQQSRHRGIVLRGGDNESVVSLQATAKLRRTCGNARHFLNILAIEGIDELCYRRQIDNTAMFLNGTSGELCSLGVELIGSQRSEKHEKPRCTP